MSIIVTIVILGIIIIIHEWGHYFSAVKCGIKVEEFAMGMGPKLFSFNKGETVFSLRLFPIGGYCKMLGEDQDNPDPRAFNNKSVSRRFIVIISGAVMNFILALFLFNVLVGMEGLVLTEINYVTEGTPAAIAGIMKDDIIKKVNSTEINTYMDFAFEMAEYKGVPLNIEFERNGERFQRTMSPIKAEDGRNIIGVGCKYKNPMFGDYPQDIPRVNIFDAIIHGFWQFLFWIKTTLIMLAKLITFNINFSDMSGLIGMGVVIDKTLDTSIVKGIMSAVKSMLLIMAVISANVGIMNLLPLPALDGGRLLFLTIEGIRRKPISATIEGRIHFVGFMLLIILAIFVAYFDITKFFPITS